MLCWQIYVCLAMCFVYLPFPASFAGFLTSIAKVWFLEWRIKFSKIVSLKLFEESWGNSFTKIFVLDINFPSNYDESGSTVLKNCKVPKSYNQDCLKIFLLISILSRMIQFSGYRKCPKLEVWRKLGQVMTENVFPQTITELFETK